MAAYLTVAIRAGATSERVSLPVTPVAADWIRARGVPVTGKPEYEIKTDMVMAIFDRDRTVEVAR